MATNTSGYGFVLNRFIDLYLGYIYFTSTKYANFIIIFRILTRKIWWSTHTVYSDDGTWYPGACNVLGLKNYLHSPLEKSFIERVIQYFKDRSESFDDYYPCSKKDKCNLEHVYNSIELFASMYNDTIVNKNKIAMLTKEKLIIS